MENYRDRHKRRRAEKAEVLEKKRQSLELNPYWKDGGSGLPSTSDARAARFWRPDDSKPTGPTVVKAPLLPERIAKRWPDGYEGKEFIVSSDKEFSLGRVPDFQKDQTKPAVDKNQLNKLNARLIKAEMMGDRAMIEKLKRQISDASGDALNDETSEAKPEEVLLMKTNLLTGESVPVLAQDNKNPNRTYMDYLAEEGSSVRELVRQERMTSADDQLQMFNPVSKRTTKIKVDQDWTVDDVSFSSKKKGRVRDEKAETSEAIQEHLRSQQMLDTCSLCTSSSKFQKYLAVAIGVNIYLAVPPYASLVDGYCILAPCSHVASTLHLEDAAYKELRVWCDEFAALCGRNDQSCLFIETVKSVRKQPHMFLECIPIPSDLAELAKMYFKKAILECDVQWAQNKQLIDFRDKDIRKSIPKGFSYFAVHFSTKGGFAHVIENEGLFPSWFGQEVVGGILDLEPTLWLYPKKESFEDGLKKASCLKKAWKDVDLTEKLSAVL